MDVKEYHTLQSVFFLPNILSPLVASFFQDTANLLIYTTTLASVGTFVFAFGASHLIHRSHVPWALSLGLYV